MHLRPFARAGTLLLSILLAIGALLGPGGATPAEAVGSGGPAIPTPTAPGFVLEGVKWTDRTRVDVYYTWAGGTNCVLGTSDFSGPASTIAPDIALTQLRASIDDINTRLRGALTLSLVGEATRTDLCGTNQTKAIVVGWGSIPSAGATGRTYYGATQGASTPEKLLFARVFIRNDQNFSCPTGDTFRELKHVFTHELMHAIGIEHSTDSTAIMTPVSTFCVSPSVLQPDDIAALAALYPPPPGPSTNEPPAAAISGTGVFAATPAFSAGGQALTVFGGGSLAQLEAAASQAGATGIWAQDANGTYRLDVIGGPAFVNDAFRTAFAAGFAGPAALTLTR